MRKFPKLTTDDLVALVTLAAKCYADGHLTILKFTTGWKCMVGTPDLDSGEGRKQISLLQSHECLSDAIVAELKRLSVKRLSD
jgi:hypothetical protein